MARIEGVDLPRNKRVEIGLTYLFGIGLTRSHEILAKTGVNPDTRIKDLTDADVNLLRDYIGQHFKVEGDLRREVQLNIKRLIEIGCYRGLRHRRNLPARGQRTRTNARTRKGPKKTVAGRGRRRVRDGALPHPDRPLGAERSRGSLALHWTLPGFPNQRHPVERSASGDRTA